MSKLQRTTLKEIIKEVIKEELDDTKLPSRKSLNEDEEEVFTNESLFELLDDNISGLEKLIKQKTGISCKFDVEIKGNYVNIISNDLIKEAGNVGKLICKEIYFSGYTLFGMIKDGIVAISFDLRYTYLNGGSNGASVNKRDCVWFDIAKSTWIWPS